MQVITKNSYVALLEMDFTWEKRDVKKFVRMWKKGKPLKEIAKHFKRDPDEAAILLMDLSRKGKIQPRKGGL